MAPEGLKLSKHLQYHSRQLRSQRGSVSELSAELLKSRSLPTLRLSIETCSVEPGLTSVVPHNPLAVYSCKDSTRTHKVNITARPTGLHTELHA